MHSSSSTVTPSRFRWASRPLPRRQRRLLVLATYAAFAAFLAVMYLGYTAEPRWPAALALGAGVLFAATAAGFLRLLTAPGYAADSLDRRLDERQRLVRDRAYRTASYGWTAVFAVLSLGLMYAAGNADAWLSLRDVALFVPWLTFLPGSLPTAVVAWTEPDLDSEL